MRYFILAAIYLFPFFTSAELRTIKDKEGRSIDVQILSADADSILVEMADGREFDIPLSTLSKKDRSYFETWTPQPLITPENPIDAVVLIKSPNSMGTGFFAHSKGRIYLYTNQHVIVDVLNLTAINSQGNEVRLGRLEVSDSEDMARFLVSAERALPITDSVNSNETVTVLGNSEGAGVVTSAVAKVKGIGPTEVEVDADFVPGNSGGPVINERGEVIGMATYILRPDNKPDWVNKDTRYGKARRFTLRPSRVNDWVAVTPEEYLKQRMELDAYHYKVDQAYWTFQMLDEGKGYLSTVPAGWHRDVTDILNNHNRRQQKPDSTRTNYYTDGFYTGSTTVSHREAKEASKRANLRALERFIDSELSDFYRLNDSYLKIGYFRSNKYDGSNVLEQQVKQLLADIKKEIDFSKGQ